MKRIIIRKALLRDQRVINKLVTKYMGSLCNFEEEPKRNKAIPFMYVYNLNKDYINEIIDRFYLAVDSDTSEIIGCFGLKDVDGEENCKSIIMAIEDEYRGMGIGTNLLNKILEDYNGTIICNIPFVFCYIKETEDFLIKNGFSKVRDIMKIYQCKIGKIYLPFKDGYRYYYNPQSVMYYRSEKGKLI